MQSKARAFTLIELLVVISIIALLLGILLPALGRAQQNAKKIQDATQVRGIMQSMVQFASDNRGSYPLPDRFDNGAVNPGSFESENRTGSILSMMIFQQTIVPELCVSPTEAGQIVANETYEFDNPNGAANPPRAFYDPKFKGSPVDNLRQNVAASLMDTGLGHNSYAHMAIAGSRANLWQNSLSSARPIWANRGPVYSNTTTPPPGSPMGWVLAPGPTGTSSTSLFLHGSETQWEGNVAFADGHVEFANEQDPSSVTFLDNSQAQPITQNDNLFVDETNEGTMNSMVQTRRNAYLRIWSQGIPLTTQLTSQILDATATSTFAWVDGNTPS